MDSNSVGTAALVAASVDQLKLATAQGTVSISLGNDVVSGLATLPGGSYGFYPEVKVNQNTMEKVYIAWPSIELDPPYPADEFYFNYTTYRSPIAADNENDGHANVALTARQRYITASPPYDLGDGLCYRFTFCKINKTTGEVEGAWTAPDAPWHNNGPTDIRAGREKFLLIGDGYDHQSLYVDAQHIKRLIAIGSDLTDQQFERLQEWFSVSPFLDKVSVTEEIPQSVKNADMGLIPHPFSPIIGNCEIVLLDPISDLSAMLNEMDDEEQFLAELFTNGFFKISNKELSRVSPPGVKTVSYRWR
jgi:hypothetical protein